MESNGHDNEPSDLGAMDRALLLALSSVRRESVPLSSDQENLLDDWMAGRLAPADADRAAQLTARNGLAAEHVLERRLIGAANAGVGVPAALSARVLATVYRARTEPRRAAALAAEPRRSSRSGWSIFGWSAAGLAFAATIAVAVFGVQNWREITQPSQRMQLAMVTIDDRRPFSGASQMRSLRNNASAPTQATEGFRDVNIPADLLRRAIASAESRHRPAAVAQLKDYLPPDFDKGSQAQVVIDSALSDALSRQWSSRTIVPIRVYDLADAHTKAIRDSLRLKLGTTPQVLLTIRR